MKDISNLPNNPENSKLWNNSTAYLSYDPSVVTHYVIRQLGELCKEPQALIEFESWKPGNMNSAVESEIYRMHINNPVEYWIKISEIPSLKHLAKIALRIISIPPTEAACERVFSSRREIMTKHISRIRNDVLEARANFNGLFKSYQ